MSRAKPGELVVELEGEAKEGDERTEPTQHYLTKHEKSSKSQKFPAKIHGLVRLFKFHSNVLFDQLPLSPKQKTRVAQFFLRFQRDLLR